MVVPPAVRLDAARSVAPCVARGRTAQRRRREHRHGSLRARRCRGRARPHRHRACRGRIILGALLAMLRRVPVLAADGARVGRELGSATVGLVGLTPAARAMVELLAGFGSRIIGYDPAVHASDGVWSRWRVQPATLRGLLAEADAVCIQLDFFSRYQGLFGQRSWPIANPSRCSSASAIRVCSMKRRLPMRCRAAALPQPGSTASSRRARAWPAACRHRHLAGHATHRQHDARIAPAQRLGSGQAHRSVARRSAQRRGCIHGDGARRAD